MTFLKLLLLSTALVATTLPHSAQAQTTVPVRDFQASAFEYGYEGWKDMGATQTKTASGVEIKGSAKGGAGCFFSDAPVDLSQCTQLELKIRQGAENTQDVLILRLQSSDGKSSTLDIKLKDVSKDQMTTVTLDLGTVKGVKDGVDLKSISGVQIQGTFNPSTLVDFEIGTIIGKSAPPAAPAPAPAPAPAN